MASPKGNTAEDYLEAYYRLGSYAAVAREFGVDKSGVRAAIDRIGGPDPAIKGAMNAIGTQMQPSIAWVKTKPTDDEPGYSVMLRPGPEPPEAVAERVRTALEGMTALPEVPAPDHVEEDLCTLYPIADVHLGMLAWARETGEAYSTDLASERLAKWIGQCIASSPASHTAIILDNGDLTHADDNTNQTPQNKHALDTDTRHYRTLDTAIEALAFAIELALQKHKHVLFRILPGNHNRESYLCVMFALAERFRDNPRVKVQKVPGEFFHHKAQDIGGVQWEQLRAVTARDAYAVSHAYCARAQLQGITFDRNKGEISRVKVAA